MRLVVAAAVVVALLAGCDATSRRSSLPSPTPVAPPASTSGTKLDCLVAVSGGAEERPTGIAGTLRMIGGPPPGMNRSVAGTVTIESPSGATCDVSVVAGGSFAVSVPPGRYAVTGHSPNFGSGKYLCSSARQVNVARAHPRSNPVSITVVCPIR
jgi:hypothetical protein